MLNRPNRRDFLAHTTALGAAALLPGIASSPAAQAEVSGKGIDGDAFLVLPSDQWSLWLDEAAPWKDDEILLPGEFRLNALKSAVPTGGWEAMFKLGAGPAGARHRSVQLPTTVEQHFWAATGSRPYTPDEYRYAADDPIPRNGAYEGVSWFWRSIDVPAEMQGKRILLELRGARLRAEVFWNEQLVGYSILEELPFQCDVTQAARPGGQNRLAIRITNPGGRYDWVDGGTIRWGKVNLFRSHGFGGLDCGMVLRAVPMTGHFEDLWVLNTAEPRTITVRAKIHGKQSAPAEFSVVDPVSGKTLATASAVTVSGAPDGAQWTAALHAPQARLWDLDAPNLYRLEARLKVGSGEVAVRTVSFGFRWFSPEGVGKDAIFRLNGRRLKIYTSISWGFWGFNGLFPTPELAEREVLQAKRLNLNCLNFHRNVGKQEVFEAHDRLGLLRYMEPGGGKLSIGKQPAGAAINAAGTVMQPARDAAEIFSRRFMLAKCRAMVVAHRSHPSLIEYALQNELGADLKNPDSLEAINLMHAEDPSRCVVLNDGFVARQAAQAWFAPYNDTMYRSDQVEWGGWWNNHQGAGDQWYDRFYTDPTHFTYYEPLKTALVEFGEMEGCAVADNHPLMVHQIKTGAFGGDGSSYDLEDHEAIAAAYERYFDRWGFRNAFPSSDKFYRSLGNKCYESWQQYLENIRICDDVDFAAISGWESTSIENHSGIVDNLRNFKGDPDWIASSLLPVRPVLKQHQLSVAAGEAVTFDVFLLNDTGRMPGGRLRLELVDPAKNRTALASWPVPAAVPDQFSYTVQAGFKTAQLTAPGIYRFHLLCEDLPAVTCVREIWVIEARPALPRKLRVGFSGVTPAVKRQLDRANDLTVTPLAAGSACDVLVVSGVVAGSLLDRQVGEETGLETPPVKGAPVERQVPGELSAAVLAAFKAGTPLLVIVPDDDLADGVAKQLVSLGAFTYQGQVGDTRAPWMGNWLFVKDHPTFSGMPADRVLGVHYQASGKQANGLLIEAAAGSSGLEVVMGYSRDHDRRIGAASFVCKVGGVPVLFHRVPPFSTPLQDRWLRNALGFLASGKA